MLVATTYMLQEIYDCTHDKFIWSTLVIIEQGFNGLKDRFDYGLNPEKLGAVSSYLCDPETAHAEFMLVKGQYQAETYGPAYLFLLGRGPGLALPLSIMEKAALAVELGPLYHGHGAGGAVLPAPPSLSPGGSYPGGGQQDRL